MEKILYLSLVVALGFSSSASAQGFHKGRGRGPMHGFMKLDRDQNGKITLEEMRAAKLERWLRADANNDGVITRDEVAKLRENRGKRRLRQLDTNNDGLISRDEMPRMPQAIFDSLDTDKNGSLSRSELTAGRGQTLEEKNKRFEHIDANGDGKVTKAEINEHVEERFKQLDLNGDGIVDREELKECRYGRGGSFKQKK